MMRSSKVPPNSPLVWARQTPNGIEHPAYLLEKSALSSSTTLNNTPSKVHIMWQSNGDAVHLPKEFVRVELSSNRSSRSGFSFQKTARRGGGDNSVIANKRQHSTLVSSEPNKKRVNSSELGSVVSKKQTMNANNKADTANLNSITDSSELTTNDVLKKKGKKRKE
eukprot:scaffold74416_cov41-Cyclotella_meneghiniana.AAC.4